MEYQLRLGNNYRVKDMPRYDLNIAIFDMIRYIVPSLVSVCFKSYHFVNALTHRRSRVHIKGRAAMLHHYVTSISAMHKQHDASPARCTQPRTLA